MTRRRARGDRGAVIAEFAFVIPILLVLLLGLADFALAELSDAAGANSAREGARVGVLYYDGAAGTNGSTNTNYQRISAAVSAKLAGNVKGTPTVTVRCLNPDGTARPSSGSCSTVSGDAIEAGRDFIEVSVTWNRKGGITGFVGNGFRTDKAVMRIVGTPPTGGNSGTTCTITASSASPSTVVQTGGTIPDVVFDVTVSSASSCGTPLLTFPAEAAYSGAQTMALVTGNLFRFTLPSGQGSWTAGTKTVTASANGGSVTQNITFDVTNPSVCLITAGTATPSATTHTSGDLPAIQFDVTVSGAVCGTPTLTFPAQAGYGGAQTMSLVSGNDFRFTMPANQGTWTAATYTIVANAAGGATWNISLVVSDPPVCSLFGLTMTPNPVDVKSNGQLNATLTITVQRSSTTVCAVPTVAISALSGSGSGVMTCSGLTCTRTIAKNDNGWGSGNSGTRTVTVTASGASVSGTLNVT
ncbi:MAG: TadE/TadG family type IV pilus assembly protein [Microthrixaceae bacterium]